MFLAYTIQWVSSYGPRQAKKYLRACAKCTNSDIPMHAHIIPSFALHSYILLYPLILLDDGNCSDQTLMTSRLIWAFAVRKA